MLDASNLDAAIAAWLNEYAPHGILTTDSDLVICGWNRWLEQHSGRPANAMVGVHLFVALPELIERNFDQFYTDALRGQTTVLAHRFHGYFMRMAAKAEYPLTDMQQTARISPLVAEGKVIGTVTAIDDVSERVFREHELDTARQEAEHANREKDKFLAMLSHDLRTPLTAIMGWTKIMRENSPTEETREKALESIRRNAEIQLQLIEQIVDISRIASGKFQLQTETVDVKDAIELALDAVQQVADAKDIRLKRVLPVDGRMTVADPKRVQQIVWNLLSNAIKFTPKGGSVSVTLRYQQEGFHLIISDTGIGISSEHLDSIFQTHWQADDSLQGGLGLGLAIVQQVVSLHGGSIKAQSAGVGHGTTFVVKMPWAAKSVVSSG
jgi:signal transduction histidine kinase